MSSPAAIVSEDLAKRYRLGATHETFRTLRDALTRLPRRREAEDRHVWALDGVSFELPEGEAVGVIGPNGAGKSTLLKILSKVTEPTRGRATVRGRVGSLLEVGTGFHLELTGRENIFLNGAILGMRRAEIVRKLDEIVAFAEVERFLDTPVKRYSSGMYVRLAFAVAAHLEANILLVDEVLSVGDLAFQQKCLGKMHDQTTDEGRTVLFVSHNLASIKALTSRTMWLERGKIREFGDTEAVFREYVSAHASEPGGGERDLSDVSSGRYHPDKLATEVVFHSIALRAPDGHATDMHLQGEPILVDVVLRCQVPRLTRPLELMFWVRTLENVLVFVAKSDQREVELVEGLYRTTLAIDPNVLMPGVYAVDLGIHSGSPQDQLVSVMRFRIESDPEPNADIRYESLGLLAVDYEWSELQPAAERAIA